MNHEIYQLSLNSNLIKRSSDYCLFDPDNFKLIRLNQTAFGIIERFESGCVLKTDLADPDFKSFEEIPWVDFEKLKEFRNCSKIECAFDSLQTESSRKNSFAILANGDLTWSEFEKPFGNIYAHMPSYYID